MDTISFGKYRLTEKRVSVWTKNKTMLHFHRLRSEGLMEEVRHVKTDAPQPDGDLIIPCEDPQALTKFELGSVYEFIFIKQDK